MDLISHISQGQKFIHKMFNNKLYYAQLITSLLSNLNLLCYIYLCYKILTILGKETAFNFNLSTVLISYSNKLYIILKIWSHYI